MNPTDRKYSKEHEWVKIESGDVALVGITHFAQDQLGDIVFVYFPDDLESLEQFKSFGEIESPKAVSELFAPVSGQIIEVNAELQEHPELVNEEPYEDRVDAQSPTLRPLRNGQPHVRRPVRCPHRRVRVKPAPNSPQPTTLISNDFSLHLQH